MKKIMVTGGGGFIGHALVQKLVSLGLDVRVMGRNRYPYLEQLGVDCIQGDICDPESILQATAGVDTVFHVAAKAGMWGQRADFFAANVQGTRNVLDSCLANTVPVLVYTSTPSVVFDSNNIENGNEELPYAKRPLCHYAASKIEAEKLVLGENNHALRTCAIRPHLVWGPGDNHLIPRIIERGRKGQLKIVGDGKNRVDITYIDNVVHAHILAAQNLHSTASADREAFFIGQKEPVFLWEWVNTLFRELGIRPVSKKVPYPVAYCVGGILEGLYDLVRNPDEPKMTRFIAQQLAKSHWFSHEKAERLLGYSELVSTSTGLQCLIDSLRSRDAAR